MSPRLVLPVKVPVTISTMLNFNGPNFGPNCGVGTCEQSLKSGRRTYRFQDFQGICFMISQLSFGPGNKLKSDTKPGPYLKTSVEHTSPVVVGSDASPADVVNAARNRNEGNYCRINGTYLCSAKFPVFLGPLIVEDHIEWNSDLLLM